MSRRLRGEDEGPLTVRHQSVAAEPSGEEVLALPAVRSRGLTLVARLATRHGGVFRLADAEADYVLKAMDGTAAREDSAWPYWRAKSIHDETTAMRALNDLIGGHFVDGGRHGRVTWLLQRWVTGASASTLARRHRDAGALSPLIELYAAQARMLAAIHEAGWLHCDLQPAHFVHRQDGAACLIDLGFARRVDDDSSSFRGQLLHYAAPEFIRSSLQRDRRVPTDVRMEIYSFGAVMFEMHSGKTATDYGNVDPALVPKIVKMRRVLEGRRNCLPTFGGRAGDINDLIERCLQPDPARRPASMREVASTLEAILTRRRAASRRLDG